MLRKFSDFLKVGKRRALTVSSCLLLAFLISLTAIADISSAYFEPSVTPSETEVVTALAANIREVYANDKETPAAAEISTAYTEESKQDEDFAEVETAEDDTTEEATTEEATTEEATTEEPEPVVEYITRTETEEIEFDKVTEETDEQLVDYSEIIQEGENGEREIVYIDKYIDGELVDTEKDSSEITKEPVDEITLVGTTENVVFADGVETISNLEPPEDFALTSWGSPRKFKRIITGTAKAYSGDTHTATGKECQPGYIAVDPRQIPYGTKLWVVSADGEYVYGYCSAEDTGGFVKKKSCTIDVYLDSEEECYDWGNRDVIIYVLYD